MHTLTAKYADIWNIWFSNTGNDLEKLKPLMASVNAACEAIGRDPASLQKTAVVKVETGPHAPSTMSEPAISGSPEEIAQQLRNYAAAGVSHVQLWIEPSTLQGYESFAPVLELLDQS